MIDVHFVILGAALGALGSVTYVRATLAGEAQPNRVTWLLWTVAPLLAFAVEVRSGVGLRSLMTLMVAVSPAAIFAASFANPRASWRLGTLDYL
ncbi:MAG TPA: hypothetical protein VKY15_00875, partial [Acidimicrobiales bacterium]|nr:hypothetical protein [Acidimicrobiales bacterium]